MKIIILFFLLVTGFQFGQDISFEWQKAEDFHNAGEYDSVIVYMPKVESYLREIGFEKQRMIALFYLANSYTYSGKYLIADSLYNQAISLAEQTGEEHKRKEIYYRRIQINTDIVHNTSIDSLDKMFLLDNNINSAMILQIPDVYLSALYEKAKYFNAIGEYARAFPQFQLLLFHLTRYLPKSSLFEKRVFMDILANFIMMKKYEDIKSLLKYRFFREHKDDVIKYLEKLKSSDEIGFKILAAMIN